MGRKNYLFSKSDSGSVDNAIFYSLIAYRPKKTREAGCYCNLPRVYIYYMCALNLIKPSKNSLFCVERVGAVSARPLIESCEIVGIEPLRWLTDVLDSLRDDTPPDQVRQMLPYYYKKPQG